MGKRSGKKRPAICAYCGTEGTDWTDDEPVPKCLFMPPKDNLISVPACAKCNNELKSIDDAFLRHLIPKSVFCEGRFGVQYRKVHHQSLLRDTAKSIATQ